MDISFSTKILISAGFMFVATLLFSKSASAQTADNNWQSYSLMMRYKGGMFTDKQKALVEKGEAVYTTNSDVEGLQIDCIGGRLRAGLTLQPQNVRSAFKEVRLRGTSFGYGKVFIDMELNGDERVALGHWAYDKKEQSAKSLKRKPAAKLYNAVVRRDNIRLLIEGREPIVLHLPKPNAKFANFGAACGIGKLARK